MANDDWQFKAVQEQFDVFDKLFEPCSSYAVTDLSEIIKKVNIVLKRHLTANNVKTATVRHISAELIKAIPEQENNLHISYAVVVTNEEKTNGNLSKIPVFRVLVDKNQHTFIDISGSVYKSWHAFMKNNDLPDCKFCYPVNGCYEDKLKIDFALSPAASRSQRNFWFFTAGLVIGVAIVAASFFFEISPIVFSFAPTLINIAEQFLPKIAADALKHTVEFVKLGQLFKEGKICVFELTKLAYPLLCKFHSNFKENISFMWEKTKKVMSAAYNYLRKIFAKYFENASSESQNSFFATVVRVESETCQAVAEASAQLQEMNTEIAYYPMGTRSSNMVLSYNQQIFQNCLSESALQQEIKNHYNDYDNVTNIQPFKPTTENLLILSQTLANQLGVETLSDLKDIFESLNCIVKDEYKNKIDYYIKGVQAAMAATSHGIHMDVYNKSLGIVGDPKDHFMKEAMESVQESRIVYRLKEKIKEFQMVTKIFLIPIYKKSEEDYDGIYKSIGVRGKGKFNADWLLRVLKESLINVDERTLVVNETNSGIYIRSEEISIFAIQEVNDENTSEGVVYVNTYFQSPRGI